MRNLNFPETAFEAGAILSACDPGDPGVLKALPSRWAAPPCADDCLEEERREVLDAIVIQMRADARHDSCQNAASENWDVHRRLLQHLAHVPRVEFCAYVQ